MKDVVVTVIAGAVLAIVFMYVVLRLLTSMWGY